MSISVASRLFIIFCEDGEGRSMTREDTYNASNASNAISQESQKKEVQLFSPEHKLSTFCLPCSASHESLTSLHSNSRKTHC